MTVGKARAGFDIDLADGKLREDAFARVLFAGRELYEHKRDFQCLHTRNVAVEYQTSPLPNGAGKPYRSGIAVSKAYWYAIEFSANRRLVLPIDDVKCLARRAIRQGRHKWIGDDNRFHNALVPIEWFYDPQSYEETLLSTLPAQPEEAAGDFGPHNAIFGEEAA